MGSNQIKLGSFLDGVNNLWIGSIDEVGFWNRTLDASEIQELYNNGNGLAYSQPNPLPQNATFENVNITNNLTVGQNIFALNGFFSSLGTLINQVANLFVTNAIITNLNVTGLLYGDGSHLTNIPVINSSYYLITNPFGFYNSTNPPPSNEPNWNSNSSIVAYINRINNFNRSIIVSTGNISITGNTSGNGLLTLPRTTLPFCDSMSNGSIGRNSTGLFYCPGNGTNKWIRLALG